VTEHEVAAPVAIVAVQAAPVLIHSAAHHAAFYTYGARRSSFYQSSQTRF
jgi:hypothetical protein